MWQYILPIYLKVVNWIGFNAIKVALDTCGLYCAKDNYLNQTRNTYRWT